MTAPAWFSQPYPPEGASAAEGIRNQLGKPELDRLTILVRESAQNSWDARRDPGTTVDYRIDLRTVSAADTAAWRQNLLRKAPLDAYLPLRKTLQQSMIRVLSISDRGTTGLGGPTRADEVGEGTRDFVSFIRNIGEPRDNLLGGGTYGFGKGILYLVSKPGVILVHTRCEFNGRLETRLMGAALWKSYQASESTGERRYTGRHWWGDDSGDVVEPLVGGAADSMARQLGLRPFAANETGTTITLIDPELEEFEPAEAAAYLAETIAWQLWPKMIVRPDGVVPMSFTVTCDGITYPVPDPTESDPLRLFVAAYRAMSGADGRELSCQRPKKLLGRLGVQRKAMLPFESTRASEIAGIERSVHHICLMRPAELVVTYWPGPKPASELISYAGVFRADDEMDDVYASAEPPTHDSWNPQSLERPDSTFVRVTFQRFGEVLEGLLDLHGGGATEVSQVSLGAASDKFSPLVGGSWGVGGATDYGVPGDTKAPVPGRRPAPREESDLQYEFIDSNGDVIPTASNGHRAGGTSDDRSDAGSSVNGLSGPQDSGARRRVPRPRVTYVGEPYLDEYSGTAVLVQEFQLPVPIVQRVSADLAVALTTDGGRETDPPLGAEQPGLVGWEDEQGRLSAVPSFVIEGGDGKVWKAIVKPAADTMTEIAIFVERVSA
ncbi:hypothetical protein [Nocardia huaxiensis]|uniref:hypothetical protein n=1 Tax=Nocardia huaxiensis TaxID=2755382 RepID=UPI001E5B4B6D|nr:hypothetical protein [Nocardia huaxiensis]UFS96411.1 hypothetical protein LPY97_00230 [Nocardia huaxiensis]